MTPTAARLRSRLLPWFDSVRRDLPWRRTRDPYAIWLSEVMLQQTRVETVIPYFERFLAQLPDVDALAEAPSDQVMSLWSGLGYYRRARMLHDAAREIARERRGAFPATAAGLAEIRGIGRYTAGAIASIAYGERAAVVDGNVARVLARIFAIEDDVRGAAGARRLWSLAGELVPEERPGAWNEALMELGATVCLPRAPSCATCPVRACCEAFARGLQGELPVLPAKRKPPIERKVGLVVHLRREILLLRRRPDQRFGGTWEPPLGVASRKKDAARAAFESLLGVTLPTLVRRGDVAHTLSHRRLEIQVFEVRVTRMALPAMDGDPTYDAAGFVSPASFGRLGMSTLARKVLGVAAGDEGRS